MFVIFSDYESLSFGPFGPEMKIIVPEMFWSSRGKLRRFFSYAREYLSVICVTFSTA